MEYRKIIIGIIIVTIAVIAIGCETLTDDKFDGKITKYNYNTSGGMLGDSYDIWLYKDENSKTVIKETEMDTWRHVPVTYYYDCPDDTFERLEALLKENKLTKTVEAEDLVVYDGGSSHYTVYSDNDHLVLFSGQVMPSKRAEAFTELRNFINELKSDTTARKDDNAPIFGKDSFIGFELSYDGTDILLRKEAEENTGYFESEQFIPSDELIDKALDVIANIPEIGTVYPFEDPIGTGKRGVTFNLFVKGEEGDYNLISKYFGNNPPVELTEAYREIYELVKSEMKL